MGEHTRVDYRVGNRLPNGKWPLERITWEVMGEFDTLRDAALAAYDAQFGPPAMTNDYELIDWQAVNREQWSRGRRAVLDEDGSEVTPISVAARLLPAVESDDLAPGSGDLGRRPPMGERTPGNGRPMFSDMRHADWPEDGFILPDGRRVFEDRSQGAFVVLPSGPQGCSDGAPPTSDDQVVSAESRRVTQRVAEAMTFPGVPLLPLDPNAWEDRARAAVGVFAAWLRENRCETLADSIDPLASDEIPAP